LIPHLLFTPPSRLPLQYQYSHPTPQQTAIASQPLDRLGPTETIWGFSTQPPRQSEPLQPLHRTRPLPTIIAHSLTTNTTTKVLQKRSTYASQHSAPPTRTHGLIHLQVVRFYPQRCLPGIMRARAVNRGAKAARSVEKLSKAGFRAQCYLLRATGAANLRTHSIFLLTALLT
jgi:hypothetical protein